MHRDDGFFDQEQVKQKIEDLWAKVFSDSNKLLNQHISFGFNGVLELKDPTVQERVFGLQVFNALIDVLINSGKAGVHLEYEQTKQLLNAKSQITTMGQLAAALVEKNQEDYDMAVAALDKQAVF